MTRAFKIWLISLFLTAAIVLISVQWLDKPLALEVRAISGQRNLPIGLTESPLTSTSLAAALAFLVFGILATLGRNFSKFETTIALCVISTLAAIIIKDQLKVVFNLARHMGAGYRLFSGQRSLWIPLFPFWKIVRVFSVRACHGCRGRVIRPMGFISKASVALFCGMLAADVGLVALNLHFLSDTIAGTFLGFSTGLFTIGLCRAARRAHR